MKSQLESKWFYTLNMLECKYWKVYLSYKLNKARTLWEISWGVNCKSNDGVGEWNCPLTMCIYGSAAPCFLICIVVHPSPKLRAGLIISLISGSKVTWGALSCPFMDLVCLLLLLPCSSCKKSCNSSCSHPFVRVDPPKTQTGFQNLFQFWFWCFSLNLI